MKKLVSLLIGISLMLTGCTAVRIDTKSIDNIVDVVLSKENKLYNQIGKGYKYYIPRGVTYIDTIEFNDKLYSNGDYYYLYIDAISYYYNKEVKHKKKSNAYYYRELNDKEKKGYIEITQVNNKYLVEFMYNYARIETLVEKEKINSVILNSSYILSTVKFNNKVIKIMLNEDYFKNKEEKFELFEKVVQEDNILEYSE